MLTLYGAKGSGAAAPEAALRIAGVPFRWVEAASWEPSAGLEELKRVNPLAQIPTLVLEDGTVLTESAAILIWLGLRHPQSGLLPAEPAQAIRGLVFIAANCYAAIGIIDYPERFCTDCDKATAERSRDESAPASVLGHVRRPVRFTAETGTASRARSSGGSGVALVGCSAASGSGAASVPHVAGKGGSRPAHRRHLPAPLAEEIITDVVRN
jgi:hypothetical protein